MKKRIFQLIGNSLLDFLYPLLGTPSFYELYELSCGFNFYCIYFHQIYLD